jgi:hypothetical protein
MVTVSEEDIASIISFDFQKTTGCYIPEDTSLHIYRCENRGRAVA